MSSFDAAQADSTRVQIPVIARETLHKGAIVKIKIPHAAVDGLYPKDGEDIPYLQFWKTVIGGGVKLYLQTRDITLRGTRITASVSVMKKTLADGQEFLYVDLVEVSNHVPVTHKLAVMNTTKGSWTNEDCLVFETPAPLVGVIILGPPDMKPVPEQTPKVLRG